MDQSKKGSTNNLTCEVCKIDFNSNADYALHEFSKKHCDNLIRLAKQKPIVSKQKTKSDTPQVEKEPPKVTTVSHTGSFAKYGYFVPGEIYTNPETSREFNTDYDPYLQKFAENPFKEKPLVNCATETSNFCSVSSFSKKKKKKIKTCQVCNVTLSTVPEYEAHMKSPQHIWRLKVTGMGVSAHFVKASSDLHTTDINEDPKPTCQPEEQIHVGVATATTTNTEATSSGPFPLLYCSDCELLLNSPQQYNAHINGKCHLECAQKKAELKAKKEKLENPSPNQLYCYTCKISLNNLFQYNEHKNGKKHKTKCRNLIKKGITIPPEERVPGIPLPNPNRPVVYPDLYEKFVLEKQKESKSELQSGVKNDLTSSLCSVMEVQSTPSSSCNDHNQNKIDAQQSSGCADGNVNSCNDGIKSEITSHNAVDSHKVPKIIFHRNDTALQVEPTANPIPELIEKGDLNQEKDSPTVCSNSVAKPNDISGSKRSVRIVTDNVDLNCSICNESFQWQAQLDAHFATEDHYRKILEHKMNGRSDSDILNSLFSDRDVVKPNTTNKLTCSICNVTVDSSVEFDQHLSSIVHKYTQKDYRLKRTLEVKHILACNEEGLYFCKLCKEGWQSLLDYTQHLHFAKHKTIQRAHRAKAVMAKRRMSHIQKPKLTQNFKRRNCPLKKSKAGGKNPGVRTKVGGVAVDLNSGTQAPIPNLEPLEPEIDRTKNVSIGICSKLSSNTAPVNYNNNNNDKANASYAKKRHKIATNRSSNHHRSGHYHDDVTPFVIPPLMASPTFQPRFPRLNNARPNRNWMPFSVPYPFGPYCNRPNIDSPYPRPHWSQRHPWPRYR